MLVVGIFVECFPFFDVDQIVLFFLDCNRVSVDTSIPRFIDEAFQHFASCFQTQILIF